MRAVGSTAAAAAVGSTEKLYFVFTSVLMFGNLCEEGNFFLICELYIRNHEERFLRLKTHFSPAEHKVEAVRSILK